MCIIIFKQFIKQTMQPSFIYGMDTVHRILYLQILGNLLVYNILKYFIFKLPYFYTCRAVNKTNICITLKTSNWLLILYLDFWLFNTLDAAVLVVAETDFGESIEVHISFDSLVLNDNKLSIREKTHQF